MTISQQAKERILTEPAKFVEREIKAFAGTSLTNHLSFTADHIIWDEPLEQFADGDDPIFTEYKTIIAPTHFTPREALAKAYDKSPEDIPSLLSVISWILPTPENTRKSNRSQTLTPGPGLTYPATGQYGSGS